jgi:hypothetical protein
MVSEEIRGMIPDYVSGLLSPEDTQVVVNALSSIPELAKELDAAKLYYLMLNQLPEPGIPANFLDRINKRIGNKLRAQNTIDLLFKPFFPKIPLEFAGLAACLIAVVIILKPELPLPQETEPPLAINTATYINDESPQMAVSQEKNRVRTPAPRPSVAKKPDRVDPPVASQSPESIKKIAPPMVVEGKIAADKVTANAAAGVISHPQQEYPASTEPLQVVEKPPIPKESEENPANFAVVDIGAIDLAYALTSPKGNKLRAAKSAQAPISPSSMEPSTDLATLENFEASPEKESGPREEVHSTLPDQNDSPMAISEILDPILARYDSLFTVKSIHGMVSYTLTLSPDRLSALSKELQRSFSVTSRLLPFDPLVAKLVKVSFTIKE